MGRRRAGGILSGERVERRLAAILAADVAGYSRLMGQDEAGTLARLRGHRRELIDPEIAKHKGRIVKTTGDGILIEFPSVVEAVACAVAMQRGMAECNISIPEDRRIVFRVGVNLGDIIVEGDDIHGDGVNVAARLERIAEPGGICVSRVVRDQVRDKLDVAFDDMGEQTLKNIARPLRVYGVRLATLESVPTVGPVEIAPPLVLPDKPSIAVLPFQNMSGDLEQEYFADGMVEEIITALSRLRWFFVIARNSTFIYKGRAVDVKQVSRELGVRYVLEGSVRKSANRLRISAQLVDATTGNHIWAERYDRALADIFTVQDEITERVVATIEPELYAAENVRSQRKPPESLDAWECVIRALSGIGQGTSEANMEAKALCQRAITITPTYGQAHSLLAWVLLRPPFSGGDLRTALPEALAEAHTALGLDDRDAWAHMAHGIALWRMRRHDEAERALYRALELNPNFALAHAFLGSPLAARGADEQAIESANHALKLSPIDRLVAAYASFAMGFAHFAAGNYGDGVLWAHKLIERQPENLIAHALLIATISMNGAREPAAEALATLLRLRPDFSLALVSQTAPLAGEMLERFLHALRKAGLPEG
jgi:adenylate cyclase